MVSGGSRLARVTAAANSQSDVFFRIFDEGGGVSGLQLENGTVDPLIIAIAPGETLLGVAINIEDPGGNRDGREGRHADVGERLLNLEDHEVALEVRPA